MPCLSARAVAQGLTWTRRETPFAELDLFNSLLAVSETVTHLELLADTEVTAVRALPGGGYRVEARTGAGLLGKQARSFTAQP